MKKIFYAFFPLVMLVLSSCSVQEKMNPHIFIQRLKDNYAEINIVNDEILFETENYFCFLIDKSNNKYVLQFETDSDGSIKKICLVAKKAVKTDNFNFVMESIIKTYSPSEDSNKIIDSLFIDDRNYFNTQWYRYSSLITEGNLFFSVENMKISTNTDAELSLKSNDITHP